MSLEDFKSTVGNVSNTFMNRELITYIILDVRMPMNYLKSIRTQNKELKEKAESFSDEFVPLLPSAKEGGIEIELCIIKRKCSKNETGNIDGKSTLEFVEDKIILPDYRIITTFTQLPPRKFLNQRSASGFGIGDLHRARGTKVSNGQYPKVEGLFSNNISYWPSTNPLEKRDPDTGISIKANAIPEGREEEFADLIAQDKKRIAEWEQLFKEWDKATEEECETYLLNRLAERLLLCYYDEDDEEFKYIHPHEGLIECAIVDNKNDKSYFNIQAISWDRDKKGIGIHSTCNTKNSTEETLQISKLIKKAIIEKRKQKAEQNKKEVEENKKKLDDYEEEYGETSNW